MKFSKLAGFMERLEATSKRLEMIDILKDLLLEASEEETGPICFMLLGSLAPDYEGVEIGMAEKLVMRSVAKVAGVGELEVDKRLKKTGDVGEAAAQLLSAKKMRKLVSTELTVLEAYKGAIELSRLSGKGSISKRVASLAKMLIDSSPTEIKYLIRYVTGNLRLGIADMTLLDALSEAFLGGRKNRELAERAYNIRPDIGYISTQLKKEGLEGLRNVQVQVGIPIRMELAERLSSSSEILEKVGSPCAVEYKYDGERIQAHREGEKIQLFSRRLENITYQYPDVEHVIRSRVRSKEAILEMECVAVDQDTGELRPFQELMRRRRKHGIDEMSEEIPVVLKAFDVLLVDRHDQTRKPYSERRQALRDLVDEDRQIQLSEMRIVKTSDEMDHFFQESVAEGMEGIMAKALDGEYEAGARSFKWVKLKREYRSELRDTIDLVVVGAYAGMGKRSQFRYGSFLMSAYDPDTDTFPTVCKVGTGFKDEDLRELGTVLDKYKAKEKPPRVDSKMDADVWFIPGLVLEIIGAEITLSPIHMAAWNRVKEGAGLAIRFPRFTGKYRTDKSPEDATTTTELIEIQSTRLQKVS
jgi:DNA ligase-1